MEKIGEDDSDDDIEEDSNENQEEDESVRRKIIFGIFYRPHDMTELAEPGGVEQELRTFLQKSQFSSCYSLISYYAQFIHSSS